LAGKKSTKRKKEPGFEEALGKLEQIVFELEEGELSLEEALEKFKQGIELARFCTQKLTQAEEKVSKLLKSSKDEFKIAPLDLEEDE
jgi:exodeoxyribonuclease VII small subunit